MRLKSEIWVKAYLRRVSVQGAMGVVSRHGDDDAGAIFIRVLRADGETALFAPAPAGRDDADFDRRFVPCFQSKFVPSVTSDEYLARETRFDSDIWIVEVEDTQGRDFLGDDLAN